MQDMKLENISGTKRGQYLKEFATHSKNTGDSYREIKEFKNSHQPITNIAMDENRDLL